MLSMVEGFFFLCKHHRDPQQQPYHYSRSYTTGLNRNDFCNLEDAKLRTNSSAICRIRYGSIWWLIKLSTLRIPPGKLLPSFRMRSFNALIVSFYSILKVTQKMANRKILHVILDAEKSGRFSKALAPYRAKVSSCRVSQKNFTHFSRKRNGGSPRGRLWREIRTFRRRAVCMIVSRGIYSDALSTMLLHNPKSTGEQSRTIQRKNMHGRLHSELIGRVLPPVIPLCLK